jgi:hypothetical protein
VKKRWRWLGLGALVASAGTLTALQLSRKRHLRSLRQLEAELAQPGDNVLFQPEMVSGLPEPAKRYLLSPLRPEHVSRERFNYTCVVASNSSAAPIPQRSRRSR